MTASGHLIATFSWRFLQDFCWFCWSIWWNLIAILRDSSGFFSLPSISFWYLMKFEVINGKWIKIEILCDPFLSIWADSCQDMSWNRMRHRQNCQNQTTLIVNLATRFDIFPAILSDSQRFSAIFWRTHRQLIDDDGVELVPVPTKMLTMRPALPCRRLTFN